MAYTKLFSSIITSTIWMEDDQTRIVWITMLAIADKNGEVMASIPGLARISGVSLEACEKAIAKFLSPDLHSRTPDDEGRRLEKIDGGWSLLNHAKYRDMASKDEAIAANAERQRRFKAKLKRNAVTQGNVLVTQGNEKVTLSNAKVTHNRDIAEAYSEAPQKQIEEKKEDRSPAANPVAGDSGELFKSPHEAESQGSKIKPQDLVDCWNYYDSLPKVKAFTDARKKAAAARLRDSFFVENFEAAIAHAANTPFLTGANERGWQATFDWLIQPDSIVKIMEGKYDGKPVAQLRAKPPVKGM